MENAAINFDREQFFYAFYIYSHIIFECVYMSMCFTCHMISYTAQCCYSISLSQRNKAWEIKTIKSNNNNNNQNFISITAANTYTTIVLSVFSNCVGFVYILHAVHLISVGLSSVIHTFVYTFHTHITNGCLDSFTIIIYSSLRLVLFSFFSGYFVAFWR